MTVGEMRQMVFALQNEVDCRIQHGADSGGHLEYVDGRLKHILRASKFIELEHKPKLMDGDPAGTIENMAKKMKGKDDAK